MSNEMLRRGEAAAFLRLRTQTLDNWRSSGRGPKFVKVGGRILYERAELEAYVAANRRQSTAAASAA